MKKWFHMYPDPLEFAIVISVIVFGVLFLFSIDCYGAESTDNLYSEPFKVRCTCYCYTGRPCSDGSTPKEGLTVAGKPEWKGKAAILYRVNDDDSIGDVIGIFQFRDTGYGFDTDSGQGTIQTGQSIDVYRHDMDGVQEWIKEYGDYVMLQVIDVQG